MTSDNISGKQAVILLFVSFCFNVLNFVPAFSATTEPSALLWGSLLSLPLQLLLLVPALALYGRFKGQNVITVAYNRWKPLGWIYAILFFLICLINLIGTLVGFTYFMTNAVYPNTSIPFIVLSIALCTFVCAHYGFEGITRAAAIIFVFLLLSTLFICGVSARSIDLYNIHPILNDPIGETIRAAFGGTARNLELILFILLLPKMKGSVKKCAFWLVVAAFLMSFVTTFVLMGVLGEFAFTQSFPYYTLASISDTKLIQRLDSLHMMVWVFTAFVRLTLLVIVSNYCLRMILPQKTHKFTFPAVFLVAVSATIAIGGSMELLRSLTSNTALILIAAVSGMPLLMLCITKRKGKEKHAVESNITVSADSE